MHLSKPALLASKMHSWAKPSPIKVYIFYYTNQKSCKVIIKLNNLQVIDSIKKKPGKRYYKYN